MGQTYEFGPFRLDSRSGILSRGNQPLHLTAKGYSTLLLLVERAGTLVSKDELLALVWPEGFVEPANLTQTIYVLRKTLGDAGGQFIETVPGRGYRFAPSVRHIAAQIPARVVSRPPTLAGAVSRVAWTTFLALVAFSTLAIHSSAPSGATKIAIAPQAQRDYILGRHYWSERSNSSIDLGLRYFNAALRISPTYAQALSGVADSYAIKAYMSPPGVAKQRYLKQAQEAAAKAIALDPDTAEAHASLAFIDEVLGYTHRSEAAREYERSIALDGNYATAREWYSWFLFAQNKPREALGEMAQARNLDPLSPIINYALGAQLYFSRRFKDASDQWHQSIAIEPYSAVGYYGAGLADSELGHRERAVAELRHSLHLAPNDPDTIGELAYIYARARQPDSARHLLARIAKMKPVPAYDLALVHEALGQRSEAMKWLAVAKSYNDDNLLTFRMDPRMDDLRRNVDLKDWYQNA